MLLSFFISSCENTCTSNSYHMLFIPRPVYRSVHYFFKKISHLLILIVSYSYVDFTRSIILIDNIESVILTVGIDIFTNLYY